MYHVVSNLWAHPTPHTHTQAKLTVRWAWWNSCWCFRPVEFGLRMEAGANWGSESPFEITIAWIVSLSQRFVDKYQRSHICLFKYLPAKDRFDSWHSHPLAWASIEPACFARLRYSPFYVKPEALFRLEASDPFVFGNLLFWFYINCTVYCTPCQLHTENAFNTNQYLQNNSDGNCCCAFHLYRYKTCFGVYASKFVSVQSWFQQWIGYLYISLLSSFLATAISNMFGHFILIGKWRWKLSTLPDSPVN